MERLRQECVCNAISSAQHFYAPFKSFWFYSMDTRGRSFNKDTLLSVQFQDDLSCNRNEGRQLPDMFATFLCADKCSFMWRRRSLMMISRQNGYSVRMLWIDFAFGWLYIAYMSVLKQCTEEQSDSKVLNYAQPDFNTEKPKSDVKKYLTFDERKLFRDSP